MSLRYEQYWALRKTRQFLYDLLHPSTRPKTIGELKRRALSCSRHFPHLKENGRPIFSKDGFKMKTPKITDYEEGIET
jgi:hypothetical protein